MLEKFRKFKLKKKYEKMKREIIIEIKAKSLFK